MIDTHCHLNLDPLVKDFRAHFHAAKTAGINQIIVPGVNRVSSQIAVQIASQFKDVSAAVGLHPDEAETVMTTQTTQEIYDWLMAWGQKPEVLAIGESGLDYFRLPDDSLQTKHLKSFQKKLFKLHLKVATQVNKPILIHIRDESTNAAVAGPAHQDAIQLLARNPVKGVLHCFSGDTKYLHQAVDLGLYISFAGNVTFKNADGLRQLLHQVPIDRLLLETDAPFLNPNRGQWPNTPAQITKTYQVVANELDLSVSQLADQIQHNYQLLFRI